MTTNLDDKLRQLRLPVMARRWRELHEQSLRDNRSMPDWLDALCAEELAQRDNQRLARYLKESKLPPGKTLEHFDFDASQVKRERIVHLAQSHEWADKSENLLLFGPSGVGKTHLAAAPSTSLRTGIGHGLVQQGRRVLFSGATHLVQQLQLAKQELQLPQALAKLDKYALLIVDDIGYVRPNAKESSVLFELVAHRYESNSLLITSNQPFSAWDSLFGDSAMAVAAVDRLVHHAHIVDIQGESYRKSALQRRDATN